MGRSGSSGAEPEGAELEWGRCIRYIYGWRWVRQQQGSMLMKFFVDTADLSEIRELAETGLMDGVTTNPSLIAKSGRRIHDVIAEICDVVPGTGSAEEIGRASCRGRGGE